MVFLLSLSVPAVAQQRPARPTTAHTPTRPANGPRSIGKFDDWQAATHVEGGQTVCYAFTRASTSAPAIPGRGDVVLTVTQRPGAARDAVAISVGYTLTGHTDAVVVVDQVSHPFYTAQRSAFARDGHAVVMAFEKGRTATARSPAPRNTQVTDVFSLRGFSPAYAAVNRACPPSAPAGR